MYYGYSTRMYYSHNTYCHVWDKYTTAQLETNIPPHIMYYSYSTCMYYTRLCAPARPGKIPKSLFQDWVAGRNQNWAAGRDQSSRTGNDRDQLRFSTHAEFACMLLWITASSPLEQLCFLQRKWTASCPRYPQDYVSGTCWKPFHAQHRTLIVGRCFWFGKRKMFASSKLSNLWTWIRLNPPT